MLNDRHTSERYICAGTRDGALLTSRKTLGSAMSVLKLLDGDNPTLKIHDTHNGCAFAVEIDRPKNRATITILRNVQIDGGEDLKIRGEDMVNQFVEDSSRPMRDYDRVRRVEFSVGMLGKSARADQLFWQDVQENHAYCLREVASHLNARNAHTIRVARRAKLLAEAKLGVPTEALPIQNPEWETRLLRLAEKKNAEAFISVALEYARADALTAAA